MAKLAEQMREIANAKIAESHEKAVEVYGGLVDEIRQHALNGEIYYKWNSGRDWYEGGEYSRNVWYEVVAMLKLDGFHVDTERSGGAIFISWR